MSCFLTYPDPEDAVDMTDLSHTPSDQLDRDAEAMLARATIVLPEYGHRTSEAEQLRVRSAFERVGLVFYRAQGQDSAYVVPAAVVEEATSMQQRAFEQRNGIDDLDEPLEVTLAEIAQETRAFIDETVAQRGVQARVRAIDRISEIEAA
jgi:hypothetical protein